MHCGFPRKFLDLSTVDAIVKDGVTLYRLEDAITQSGVMSGRTKSSLNYHITKVLSTFGEYPQYTVGIRRKGEGGVLTLSGTLAQPGHYVCEALLYKLLFLSTLQEFQRCVEDIITEVVPQVMKQGWYISPNLSAEQKNQILKTLAN
jgi:prophage antirepressor-like protein